VAYNLLQERTEE